MAKFFLGGLSPTSTNDSILDYFSAYGVITDAVAMFTRDGKPRKFGFVTFEDQAAADAVWNEAPHTFDGATVELKSADGKGGPGIFPEKQQNDRGRPQSRGYDNYDDYAPAKEEPADGGYGSEPVKLFLGGLHTTTTTDMILAYFEKYGPITDAVAMKSKDGVPRGFGFVTFQDAYDADAVLGEARHELGGKEIEVKATIPRDQAPQSRGPPPQRGTPYRAEPPPRRAPPPSNNRGGDRGASYSRAPPPRDYAPAPSVVSPRRSEGSSGPRTDKIFVGGLGQTTTEELQDYFAPYGRIIDVVTMKHKDSGAARGFGFVQFDNTDSVEQVMQRYEDHQINGKWVEVKRSIPKDQEESRPRGRPGPYDRGAPPPSDKGRGKGSYGGREPYAPPRSYEPPSAYQGGKGVSKGGPRSSPY
eukprot:TRINITY_DN2637_c1_g2_i1.p1 TRINITY_DN2637_c1_g2~~TRINITY_DN2637_c1_g2_i1.p1  ORF type:complete len:441 (-),score=70.90 TRINITY_DN2637_c1_g2_i1:100-1347(-)